jgi:HD-GYP domain-containing protein (c-di-GMP phosphodiesterase class II)
MSVSQTDALSHIAIIFRKHRELILANWLKLSELATEKLLPIDYEKFSHSLETLIDDFINHIGKGDINRYLLANRQVAQSMAINDLPFPEFIKVFHLFEESYGSFLKNEIEGNEFVSYLNFLDYLHHETIAQVAEVYFEVQNATVFTLVKFAELRDYETGGHLERTTSYAVAIATRLGADSVFIDELKRSGPLHDIGKIGVRDAILLKPGKLTDEEFAEMKLHTVTGAQIINDIIGNRKVTRGYLLMARDIALYHHERYDGAGYPKKLKGVDIPLSARIFTIGDSYDAIISKRPYKEPVIHEEAVKRIVQERGKQYDPTIVDAFLGICETFPSIHAQFREQGGTTLSI